MIDPAVDHRIDSVIDREFEDEFDLAEVGAGPFL